MKERRVVEVLVVMRITTAKRSKPESAKTKGSFLSVKTLRTDIFAGFCD